MLLDDKALIEKWKKSVVSVHGWPEGEVLKQRDYEYLSQNIFEKTQVELSTTTLRRIWSNQYKSLPQVHTLNAMAHYLGHADWQTFKKSVETKPKTDHEEARSRPVLSKLLIGAIVVVVAVLFTVGLTSGREQIAPDFEVSLEADQMYYEGVPATAGFKYDISKATAPVSIELSWNPMERAVLDPTKNLYTGVYYYPDYHSTKLLSGGFVLERIPVYVTTDDWHALAMKEENDVYPIYIETSDFLKDGQMGFDKSTLEPYLLETPKSIYSVFTLSNKLLERFDGDDMTLNVVFSVLPDKSSPACSGMDVVFKAEHAPGRIPLKNIGCHGEINMVYGKQAVLGKTNDLSALTSSLSEKRQLSIESKNGALTVRLDTNEPYTFEYSQKMGRLKVLKFIFTSFGSIESVSISSPGERKYQRNFNEEF